MKDKELLEAIAHIKKSDPRLARVMEQFADLPALRRRGKPFESLCKAIVYQQLAGAAAATIHTRFLNLYGKTHPTPQQVLATPALKLRKCGLSKQKMSYLKDLSKKIVNNDVAINRLSRLTDEKIIEELTKVKGIGRWTAEMFLMFNLRRLDVFPVGDLGVRHGMRDLYRLREPLTEKKLNKIADAWRPYRSVGSWYMWKVKDG